MTVASDALCVMFWGQVVDSSLFLLIRCCCFTIVGFRFCIFHVDAALNFTKLARPHWCILACHFRHSSKICCGAVAAAKFLQASKSLAKMASMNDCNWLANSASPKNQFHRGRPRTVPWKREFDSRLSDENWPPNTTTDWRSSKQLCKNLTTGNGSPSESNLRSIRVRRTLSNALATSEH